MQAGAAEWSATLSAGAEMKSSCLDARAAERTIALVCVLSAPGAALRA